ncbi:MAG: N-acetylmuramoyl-L-alanine amidase AmiC [Calditrichaeota bacterium]|nr:N-acetylmuramoyl-L-alanine amidase AmiC [Calditrichota bacterium]
MRRFAHMPAPLLIVTAVLLAAPVIVTAQEGPASWAIYLPGGEQMSSPVRAHGDVSLVDALSFSDALGVAYHRDDLGRYVFCFPGARAVFVPDGAFAELAGVPVQLAVPAVLDDHRLYVPEAVWSEYVTAHAPGLAALHRSPRNLSYDPPDSDVLRLEVGAGTDSVRVNLLLARPQPARIELLDSTRIALRLPSARLGAPPDVEIPEGGAVARGAWDRSARMLVIETRDPVRGARLNGPGDDCRLVITLAFTGSGGERGNPGRARLEKERRKWVIDKVVIDPGHGGRDPGAIGRNGTREKDLTLDTARILRDLIRRRLPDIEIVMTRDADVFIPLHERTQIANRVNGKLFISIHYNSAGDRRAHGLETYFLAPARTERAMEIAMRENSVVKYEQQVHEYPDLGDETFIVLTMAQAQFSRESEDLAAMVLDGIHERTRQKSRGVDQAGFYVLMGASMAAILVEGGFLSNAKEERLMRTKQYRREVAESICDAIETFTRKYERQS